MEPLVPRSHKKILIILFCENDCLNFSCSFHVFNMYAGFAGISYGQYKAKKEFL